MPRSLADVLTVVSLGGRQYQVSGGSAPRNVTWGKGPTCDCPDFTYRREATGDRCKHLRAVEAFRTADPQAALLYPMAPEDVLELLGPSWHEVRHRRERPPLTINPA